MAIKQLIHRLMNDDSLARKASLNSVALLLDYAARIIVNLVTVRFLLLGLGDIYYGIWQLLSQITTYLNAAGGRPTQALTVLTTNQQHTTTDDVKRQAVGSAVIVWLLYLPLLIIAGALLIWQLPYWITDAPLTSYKIIRIAVSILVINLIMLNVIDIPRSVLSGDNQGYRRIGLSALTVMMGGVGMIVAIKAGWGLIGVSASVLLTTLLTSILFFQVTKKYVTWFGIARPDRAAIKRLLKLSGWFMLWQFLWQFISFGDLILLGFLADAEAVAHYSPSRYAPQMIGGVIIALCAGLFPGLGGIIGQENYQRAAAIRVELFTLTWVAITIGGTAVLLFNRSFVTLWVGDAYYIGTIPFLILVVLLMVVLFARHDSIIIDYTLNIRGKMLISTVSVVVTIIAAYLLFNQFDMGLIGLEIGFVIGQLVLLIAYPYIVAHALHIPYFRQYTMSLRPAICTLCLFGMAAWISTKFVITSWIQLIFVACMAIVFIAAITVPFGLSTAARQPLQERAQNIIKRIR